MPSTQAMPPKKIIRHAIKKKTASAGRADGSTGYGLSKRDRFGNAYYTYWTRECCPEEHRQIVFVKVDAAAEKLDVTSGAWTYDQIRKHSLERMREIPHYVKFGAQLKFCVAEGEARLCDLNPKRTPKGIYGADCSLGGATPLRPTAPSTGLRPRVYVYDVPPRFTSWMGTFRRGDWTRDHWYGVDVMLHQQLLRSPYRTLDPEQADFFFIPLHLSLGFYSHRYDARRRLSRCLSR